MPNRLKPTSTEKLSLKTWSIGKIQKGSASAVVDIIGSITPTEEFIGQKMITHIQTLEWEARSQYLTSVKDPDTMKPLISDFIVRLQIVDRVSASRITAFIQANI